MGIFYYIDGKIINETVELNYAENYGDFKIYKGSHFDMWRKVLEKKTNKPYDYFPRGRVVIIIMKGISECLLISALTSLRLLLK